MERNVTYAYVIQTPRGDYMECHGIGNADIRKAKKFKTFRDAENYVEEIRNMASWMADFRCQIVEVEDNGRERI